MDTFKECTKCNQTKALSDFHFVKKNGKKYAAHCKVCKNAANRAYDIKNKSKVDENQRRWRKANPRKNKSTDLKRKYGITLSDYEELATKQNNMCAICKSSNAQRKGANYFIVDHNHTTGKIRGLLCDLCNKGIAYFKESTALMAEAISYVEKHNG